MRINPFESQLERLARTLTDRFGVTVICRGDHAFTDGKHIVLPSLPEPMTEGLERMVIGFLDHEMSHVAFSDFKVVKDFSNQHPSYEGMLNVVEDALIERRAMKRWPGVRANLDAMFHQIRDRIRTAHQQAEPFRRFCTAIYLKLAHYNDMLGLDQEIAGYETLLDHFRDVRTTCDAATLAEQLLSRWLNEHPPPPNVEPESPSASEGNESSDAGSEPASGPQSPSLDDSKRTESQSGSSSGPPQQRTDAEPSNPAGESPPSDKTESDADAASERPSQTGDLARSQTAARCQSDSSKQPDADSCSVAISDGQGGTLITEVLAEAIGQSASRGGNSREYRVFTKEYDRIEVLPAADEHKVKEMLGTGADTVRRLRRGLANSLRSAEKRWWREDQGRGALSPRNLHRLCIDHPRLDVFRTRSMVQGRSTAMCIVLDASGSMTSPKMIVARDSMRVLLEALGDLRIATLAFAFTTGNLFDMSTAARITGEPDCVIRERFSRFGNLEIRVIKRFEEPVKSALRRLPLVRGTGLTPLGEAMCVGARQLITRRESRKIMLVLTDGKAGCEGAGNAAQAHAQHVARQITSAGLELVGLGIKDENVTSVIEDSIVVQDIEELPTQLCKLLGRTLKKGLCHVG